MDERDPFRPEAAKSDMFEPGTSGKSGGGHSKRHAWGFIAFLMALILAGAVLTCLMILRVSFQVQTDENGISFHLGMRTKAEPSSAPVWFEEDYSDSLPSENPELPSPKPSEDTRVLVSAPASTPGMRSSSGEVSIAPHDQQDLSLQEIYSKIMPCYVSVTAYYPSGASSGSGFVITADGCIATNAHVVSGAQSVQVILDGGARYDAEILGCDTVSDLAVLKVDADSLPCVEMGDSDLLQVGDTVIAIGDPLGAELRGTMTDGIVSAINRDLQVSGRTMTLIQTNAALNEGNSGGPLINMQGQVVGINTMKISSLRASVEGLGFAIPARTAAPILSELMAQGYISGRPALGFEGSTVPTYASVFYGMPQGVYLRSVDSDSDAAHKGLQPGDVITEWNETQISSLEDLNNQLNAATAGETVILTIYRRGVLYSVEIILEQAK